MECTALQPHVRTAELPFEQIERNPAATDAQKAVEVGQQFEAVLLRQILSDVTKNMFGSMDGTESTTQTIYQDMVVTSLADSMSRAGGLGLGSVLAKQLQPENQSASAATAGDAKV
jgi:Rod binding domain-containing protein